MADDDKGNDKGQRQIPPAPPIVPVVTPTPLPTGESGQPVGVPVATPLDRVQVPEGYRLVKDEDYTTKAQAGQDLKKLKSLIPEELLQDTSKIKEFYEGYQAILKAQQDKADADKTELEKLTEQLSETEKNTKSMNAKIVQLEGEKTRLSKMILLDQEIRAAEEYAISQGGRLKLNKKFIDTEAFLGLDPQADDYEEKRNEIFSRAIQEQNAFLREFGQATGQASNINRTPGGAGGRAATIQPTQDMVNLTYDIFGRVARQPFMGKEGER